MAPATFVDAEAIVVIGSSESNACMDCSRVYYHLIKQLALLFYDYVLTFKDEVQCIWQRDFSGTAATFMLLRYGTIVSAVFGCVLSFGNVDDHM